MDGDMLDCILVFIMIEEVSLLLLFVLNDDLNSLVVQSGQHLETVFIWGALGFVSIQFTGNCSMRHEVQVMSWVYHAHPRWVYVFS